MHNPSALISNAFRFSSEKAGYNRAVAAFLRGRCDCEAVEETHVSFIFDVYGRHAIVRLEFANGERPAEYR
jgi:hypothetical protein